MKRLLIKLPSGTRAFSLIEVVIALAIVTIGMVAILGLIPQGLNSARNASDDSLIAMIVQDTIAGRKIDIQTDAVPIPAATTQLAPRWFTPDGKETNNLSAIIAMYKCEVIASPVGGVPNLETTQVRVVWPWYALSTAIKSPPNTNIFVTEIAKY